MTKLGHIGLALINTAIGMVAIFVIATLFHLNQLNLISGYCMYWMFRYFYLELKTRKY